MTTYSVGKKIKEKTEKMKNKSNHEKMRKNISKMRQSKNHLLDLTFETVISERKSQTRKCLKYLKKSTASLNFHDDM